MTKEDTAPKKETPKPKDVEVKAPLFAALVKAQSKLRAISKDARNEFSRYDYTSSEAMIENCRAALIDSGLAVGRRSWSYLEKDGKDGFPDITVNSTFFIVHPESGSHEESSISYPAIEKKGTPKDKAISAALTTSLSYWLRDILLIPRKDAEEVDLRDDREHAAKPPLAKKPTAKQEPHAKGNPSIKIHYTGEPAQKSVLMTYAFELGLERDRVDVLKLLNIQAMKHNPLMDDLKSFLQSNIKQAVADSIEHAFDEEKGSNEN